MTKMRNLKNILFEGNKLGGKAQQLMFLQSNGYNVPAFKIIPAEFLANIVLVDQAIDPIQSINQYTFKEAEVTEIINGLSDSCQYYSVRSSAIGEDGNIYSYAGQFDTFLFVPKSDLIEKIKLVWKSGYTEGVQAYKKLHHIREAIGMAVIIQEMVDADSAGVMFGLNPVTCVEGHMMISAVYGLGEGLVSGELNADNYYLENGELSKSDIVVKARKVALGGLGKGTTMVDVCCELAEKSVLTPRQIKKLGKVLTSLNEFYGAPQDVEWAIEKEEVFILQSRPITGKFKSKATHIVWDNSNIIESYPGVTLPLTFSFIREMYAVVYTQFSEMLGVNTKVINDNATTFSNMLGLLRGRVYYNLLSWYKVLSMVPGYHINAPFMEKMMGVKEKFELEESNNQSKTTAWRNTIWAIFKMMKLFINLPKERRKFITNVDKIIAEYKAIDFNEKSSSELMVLYRRFEKVLTQQWKPPLVNDFFAMIYYGLFSKLVIKWVGSDQSHLQNDLLASSKDIISVAPMMETIAIAQFINSSIELKALFIKKDANEILHELRSGNFPELDSKINNYLDKFGERCYAELKLETISYNQAPEFYIEIIQSYVNNPQAMKQMQKNDATILRLNAENEVSSSLKGKYIKKCIFKYFMHKTRDLVSNRENLRFQRTRGFGVVRQLFNAIGLSFAKENFIDSPRDIFYLSKEEIFDFIEGKSVNHELKSIVEKRKVEFGNFENDAFVPERITTNGIPYTQLRFDVPTSSIIEGDLVGIPCCGGVVKAKVCKISNPKEISDLKGQILVTASTDPGWVVLFPTASAIIVERGSLLSHSAIVARELGIPCIVGVTGLLNKLNTGDLIEMDGSTGIIKLLDNGK